MTDKNAFSLSYRLEKPAFVTKNEFIEAHIDELLPPTGFFIAPLKLGSKCIGLFYTDRGPSERPLRQEEFSAFNHFAQQANICLSVLLKH